VNCDERRNALEQWGKARSKISPAPSWVFANVVWNVDARNGRSASARQNAGAGSNSGSCTLGLFNQLVTDALNKNPDDRRCVVQMWDAKRDLGHQGKDFPCNTSIHFAVNYYGELDMNVLNRGPRSTTM
jgi:hypothetical protein